MWAVALAVYGARHDIEPYHPSFYGQPKGHLWPGQETVLDRLGPEAERETMQDKYDQALTGTNLTARILRKDPRAILEMAPLQVRSLPNDDKAAGVPKRVCMVCLTSYVYQPGKHSPCRHEVQKARIETDD